MAKDEYIFLYWDDPGDSQESVDKQCTCSDWKKEVQVKELGSCCKHAKQQEEDIRSEEEAEYRMYVIMRNGNSGEHYFNNDNDDE
jgi:hypothetical protein